MLQVESVARVGLSRYEGAVCIRKKRYRRLRQMLVALGERSWIVVIIVLSVGLFTYTRVRPAGPIPRNRAENWVGRHWIVQQSPTFGALGSVLFPKFYRSAPSRTCRALSCRLS